ncbi:hypothetical protein [Azospirillum sp. sgz302134]
MFRSTRSILLLFLLACGAALLVFGNDPSDGGRAVDSRAFLSACEASPFAASNGPDPAEAARLCSCVLSWHLREGAKDGHPLPAALYQPGKPADPATSAATPAAVVDAKAREACQSGRVPR